MQLKALSLATLGFLLLSSGSFVQAADTVNDIAVVHGGAAQLSDSYLSAFDADDTEDVDFELSEEFDEESHILTKRASDCSKYHTVSGSDSCVKIAKKYGVTLNNIYDWNPQIKSGCPNLNNGKKYCVQKGGSASSKISNLAAKKSTTKKKATKKSTKKSSSKKSSSKKETRKKLQSKSAFTYYWIAQPGDYSGGKSVSVKTCSGKTIGSVGENYADALVMEGTGVVGSKIVNLGGCSCSGYKCFELVDKESDPYGLTSFGTPLRPYVTIASNDIKKNTKIYVPSLVGWKVPGSGKTHNGCLLVDDQSWSFNGKHIDFYVYSMDNYEKLDKAHKINNVDIYQGGSCKLLNYM
ncbi:carbohydrate-binding module family 50 protein [Mucor lusitanicus]|uniref:Carbohydrate-binding module family 50 protein n=1 Tax=Mucor circinelloides f. lusitanicus TaxID=29924 RepID=A0A8H4BFU5_MUCCL|nr:carbohydrate-binding module family 50 protein [Mucor lusitanicus]